MALSAFDDRSHPPRSGELKKTLAASAPLWSRLIQDVATGHGPVSEQWSFSGAKFGWSLRLKRKDRVILYLTPQAGAFLVGVVLGEKAARAAHDEGAPAPVVELIEAAPRYAEGRGIRMTVSARKDLDVARRLASLKMGS